MDKMTKTLGQAVQRSVDKRTQDLVTVSTLDSRLQEFGGENKVRQCSASQIRDGMLEDTFKLYRDNLQR
eukprot:314180-Karenia_brevis.AAC.1